MNMIYSMSFQQLKEVRFKAAQWQRAIRHIWMFRWFCSASGHTDKELCLNQVVLSSVERGADILAAYRAFMDTLHASGGGRGVQPCSEQDQLRSGIRSSSAVSRCGWRTSPCGRGSPG
ncbi:uncharacterized protein WM294_011420 isoform 1-T2 [Sarcoramphus papa]